MSRREERESDSRRHRSRFDREPSPKRSRRDGKPANERGIGDADKDFGRSTERDEKHHHRLQDISVLGAPLGSEAKAENGVSSKDLSKKTPGNSDGTRDISNPVDLLRSRSYFQHDDRGNAGQVGRSSGRRATGDRGWWKDSRDQRNDKESSKTAISGTEERDRTSHKRDDKNIWHHDGFYELEANPLPPPPVRKRPAFREQKIPVDGNADKTSTVSVKASHDDSSGQPAVENERRVERSWYSNHLDRVDRAAARYRARPYRREELRGGFGLRERDGGGGGRYKGRDTYNGRQVYRQGPAQVEKWKHDMFDEANRSPSPKNEEDRLAKIEALLAS